MSRIRILEPTLINQIAAGEVIERPASVIKEIVENAIDAGSTDIHVLIRDGGRTYMSVTDNGWGMSVEDLSLCLERHATSKIPDNNLFDIQSLGFRGEAIPSIGSVSRMTLTTRPHEASHAWKITVEGGTCSSPQPISHPPGTCIEVRDLFFATPARLKFLKAPTTELNQIESYLNRLALAYPHISFRLQDGERKRFAYKGPERIRDVLGQDFTDNACAVHATRQEIHLTGFISVPTYNRGNAQEQYLFVNGRPVHDKGISAAIRVAYQDFLARDRYPSVVLYLAVSPEDVDVNVHPTKAEVRFRDAQLIRGFIITALRETLTAQGDRSSTTLATTALASFQRLPPPPPSPGFQFHEKPARLSLPAFSSKPTPPPLTHFSEPIESEPPQGDYPLGMAKAQIHTTYIVAETPDHLILVDQHAAHERLVYEGLKQQMEAGPVARQALLIPEIMTLTPADMDCLTPHLPLLENYGLSLEIFGEGAIVVREVPSILGQIDIKQLVTDLLHEIQDNADSTLLKEKIYETLASHGCRTSVKAGRRLSLDEMNALLRQMEATPHSGQCNHGRPTTVSLDKKDIARLFGRR